MDSYSHSNQYPEIRGHPRTRKEKSVVAVYYYLLPCTVTATRTRTPFSSEHQLEHQARQEALARVPGPLAPREQKPTHSGVEAWRRRPGQTQSLVP